MTILNFKRSEVDPILRWARANERDVALAHDDGVYLIARFDAGQKCQPDGRPGRPPCRVAYASCCDPLRLGREAFSASEEAVGGDDFSVRIPLSEFKHETGSNVRVHFRPDTGAHTYGALVAAQHRPTQAQLVRLAKARRRAKR